MSSKLCRPRWRLKWRGLLVQGVDGEDFELAGPVGVGFVEPLPPIGHRTRAQLMPAARLETGGDLEHFLFPLPSAVSRL